MDPCSKNEKNKTEGNSTLEMMHAVIIIVYDIPRRHSANSEVLFYFMLGCACAARYTVVCLCRVSDK